MARPGGLEPPTTGLENRCSIRLSYGRANGSGNWYRVYTRPDARSQPNARRTIHTRRISGSVKTSDSSWLALENSDTTEPAGPA